MAHSIRKKEKTAMVAAGTYKGRVTKNRGKKLSRNQQRKLDYAAMAEAARTKSGNQSFFGRSSLKGRTNHKKGMLMKEKSAKQAEAKARQTQHDFLTPQQKLEKLDKKLGKDQGAKKERSKIQKQLLEGTKPLETKKLPFMPKVVAVGGVPVTKYYKNQKQAKKEAHDKKVREDRNGRS